MEQVTQLKEAFKDTQAYDLLRFYRDRRALRQWESAGRPDPPPACFKQRVVRSYAKRFSLSILVETGTQHGEMIYAARNTFADIYSIELDRRLYQRARHRFAAYGHIRIVPGDSGIMLPAVLDKIDQASLFWLDGHAMVGGVQGKSLTPILQELDSIFHHPVEDHVILIDDARLFTEDNDYPSIAEVKHIVGQVRPTWNCEVLDDIIRVHGQ